MMKVIEKRIWDNERDKGLKSEHGMVKVIEDNKRICDGEGLED
jgi:hypothetical protein